MPAGGGMLLARTTAPQACVRAHARVHSCGLAVLAAPTAFAALKEALLLRRPPPPPPPAGRRRARHQAAVELACAWLLRSAFN
jgi:hypothetical protein